MCDLAHPISRRLDPPRRWHNDKALILTVQRGRYRGSIARLARAGKWAACADVVALAVQKSRAPCKRSRFPPAGGEGQLFMICRLKLTDRKRPESLAYCAFHFWVAAPHKAEQYRAKFVGSRFSPTGVLPCELTVFLLSSGLSPFARDSRRANARTKIREVGSRAGPPTAVLRYGAYNLGSRQMRLPSGHGPFRSRSSFMVAVGPYTRYDGGDRGGGGGAHPARHCNL